MTVPIPPKLPKGRMQLTNSHFLTHPVTHSDMTRTPEYCGNVSFQVTGDHCPASNASDLSVAQDLPCGFISRCHSGPPFLHNDPTHSRKLTFYTALTDVHKQVSRDPVYF